MLALVTAALAVLTITLTGTPAQATSGVSIHVWHSSHCLDNDTSNYARLVMYSCTGNPQQVWYEGYNSQTGQFTFLNQNTGRCITAPTSGGGTVTMAYCDASAVNQQWNLYAVGPVSDWYAVWQSASAGLCLTTDSVANGTLPYVGTCDPSHQYDDWAEG
ncbi:RICIN domain-containing protein [Streptomyces sp. NPDC051554]|uniref:RICIN domain-containing protein n=1 Tax=Streptomyces sp. NPDC051554 TaxID=3365656 RepID=UPI00378FBBFA